MDLQSVRTGLAIALESIDGLRVYDYMPMNANPPCAVVGFPESIDYDKAFARGLDGMPVVPIYVFVGAASERSSQVALAAYADGAGPQSIKTVIESDQSCAGSADNVFVTRSHAFRNYTIGAAELLGCIFDVRIHG